MIVELTAAEQLQGAIVGAMRHIQGARRADFYGASQANAWQIDIEGALGEMAVAKAKGIYWSGDIGRTDTPDVGKLQVRTTRRDNGRLILHKRDSDDEIFILATGENGTYNLKGWLLGYVGKRDEYWTDPVGGRAAYFVPQAELNDMKNLKWE